MKAAIYARVSTLDQEPENQLAEVRRYVQARGWTAVEYVDRGVSGAKDRRAALDQLVTDARRRRFDVVVCWRLDRLGGNLKHLITLLEELQVLLAGLQRAKSQGKRLGRTEVVTIPVERLVRVAGLTVTLAAERYGRTTSATRSFRRRVSSRLLSYLGRS